MKFRIFWIDDSQTWVKSIEEEVIETFKAVSFEPVVSYYQEAELARIPILTTYADLILVDCNLPKDTRGEVFIKSLRQSRCFAHVLFYSQDAGNLTALQADKHFLHVSPRDSIVNTCNEVAEQAFRKYKHPAFMRGLLLSEFIDLENIMEDLIVQCFKSEGEYFRKSVLYKGGESYSLSTKQQFISRLIKEAAAINPQISTAINAVNFTGTQFSEKILKRRNILAHAHPEYQDQAGSIILKSSISDVDFNWDWFHETRESIHKFKNMIREIINLNLHQIVNP